MQLQTASRRIIPLGISPGATSNRGPLADRELLLLAERGGLKTDDLLWRPGFASWKPVREVCDAGELLGSRSPHPARPASEVTNNSAAAAPAAEPNHEKPRLRARLLKELKSFLIMFSYLWLVFSVFLVHEWSVLASHQIGFRFYGLAVVNALVLSKIMLIAEGLHFARRFEDKPLIYPIAYKSIAFTVLLMVAYIVKEIAVGMFPAKPQPRASPISAAAALSACSPSAPLWASLWCRSFHSERSPASSAKPSPHSHARSAPREARQRKS